MLLLDNASATTLVSPEMCWIFVVYSEMNDKCRCCLPDQGSVTLAIAWVIGLWSVNATNWRPSRKYRKCLIPRYNGNNSRSIAPLTKKFHTKFYAPNVMWTSRVPYVRIALPFAATKKKLGVCVAVYRLVVGIAQTPAPVSTKKVFSDFWSGT